MQQDAHEFLNYLLNTIADILQEERKQEKQNGRLPNGNVDSESSSPPDPTWVHEIFQGTLTNETRCLTCETVSSPVLCNTSAATFQSCVLHSSFFPAEQDIGFFLQWSLQLCGYLWFSFVSENIPAADAWIVGRDIWSILGKCPVGFFVSVIIITFKI